MAALTPQHAMRSVANHPFEDVSFGPQMCSDSHQLVFTATETGKKRCLACRLRKKKCTPVDGIAPSPSNPCADCGKFNIRCDCSGLKRPLVSICSFGPLTTSASSPELSHLGQRSRGGNSCGFETLDCRQEESQTPSPLRSRALL